MQINYIFSHNVRIYCVYLAMSKSRKQLILLPFLSVALFELSTKKVSDHRLENNYPVNAI